MQVKEKLVEVFGLDYRSLAALRIVLSLITLGDLWDRTGDTFSHYANEGMFPNYMILSEFVHPAWQSIHVISGSDTLVWVLFVVHALVALAYLVGWHTRLSGVLLWFMTSSLHARTPFVLHGGDDYIRLVLLYTMLLPTGRSYSVDNMLRDFRNCQNPPDGNRPRFAVRLYSAARSGDVREVTRTIFSLVRVSRSHRWPTLHVSAAGLGLQFQVFCVYFFSTLFKVGAPWTTDLSATYLALHLDWYRTPLGDVMLAFGKLPLQIMTWLVLQWEMFGMFLPFIPIGNAYAKMLCVLGFMALHAGFGSCMRLGQFVFIGMGVFVVFLPPLFWDLLLTRWLATPSRTALVVLYEPRHGPTQLFVRVCEQFLLLPARLVSPFRPADRGAWNSQTSSSSSPSHADGADQVVEQPAATSTLAEFTRRRSARRQDSDDPSIVPSLDISSEVEDSASTFPGKGKSAQFEEEEGIMRGLRSYCRDENNYLVAMTDMAEGPGQVATNMDAVALVLGQSPLLFWLGWVLERWDAGRRWAGKAAALDYQWSLLDASFYRHVRMEGFCAWRERAMLAKARRRGRRFLTATLGRCVRVTVATMVFLSIFWTLLYNIHFVNDVVHPGEAGYFHMSTGWIDLAQNLRLPQHWRMFAPSPPTETYYHVVHGMLSRNVSIELLKNGVIRNFDMPLPLIEATEVSFNPPENRLVGVPNHRAYKVWENFSYNPKNELVRLNVGRYICREWNRRHHGEDRLMGHRTFIIRVPTDLSYSGNPRVSLPPEMLWDHVC